MASITAWQRVLQTRWSALGVRERAALALAAGVVVAAALWSVALAPAVRTLQSSAAQTAQLGATAERMQALQARAKRLQAKPQAAPGEALRALQSGATALGPAASLQVVGEQATLSLKQVRPADLAAWLSPPPGGYPSPSEVHLQRAAGPEPLWSGTLLYRLPARQPGNP
jgi:general secretion pathway protein M